MINIKNSQTELHRIYGKKNKPRRRFIEEKMQLKTNNRYQTLNDSSDSKHSKRIRNQSSESIRIYKIKNIIPPISTKKIQSSLSVKLRFKEQVQFHNRFKQFQQQVQKIHGSTIPNISPKFSFNQKPKFQKINRITKYQQKMKLASARIILRVGKKAINRSMKNTVHLLQQCDKNN